MENDSVWMNKMIDVIIVISYKIHWYEKTASFDSSFNRRSQSGKLLLFCYKQLWDYWAIPSTHLLPFSTHFIIIFPIPACHVMSAVSEGYGSCRPQQQKSNWNRTTTKCKWFPWLISSLFLNSPFPILQHTLIHLHPLHFVNPLQILLCHNNSRIEEEEK